jgi:hypothetical protein
VTLVRRTRGAGPSGCDLKPAKPGRRTPGLKFVKGVSRSP